jgi:hypothetical protein
MYSLGLFIIKILDDIFTHIWPKIFVDEGCKKMDYLFDLRCVSKSWKAQAETNVLWLAY